MSDTGGGDIPPIEAQFNLNLDNFFRQERQIADSTDALAKTMGKLLSQGVKAGLGSMTRDAKVQLGDLRTVSAKIFQEISDKLAGVSNGKSGLGIANELDAELPRIHEALNKITVEFSNLTRQLLQDRLDFAKGYTEQIVKLGNTNQLLRQQETQSREANILLRAQLTQEADLRKAGLKEQDRIAQLGVDATYTANRQQLISDKDTADAAAKVRLTATRTSIEDKRQETSNVIEANRQATIAARTASSDQIEAQRQVTSNVKTQGAIQIEEAKKVRDQVNAAAKTQLSAQEHVQSLIRIDEQASQQARLARTQQFYKLLGDATRSGGNLVVDAGKSITSRLFHVEHDENDLRVNDYRTTAEQIDRVTADGYDRQLSSTRSFFTRQSKIERDSLISQKRLSGASVSGESLSNNLQTRSSKGLLGLVTGQSGLNLLLGGIGVGGLGAAFHVAATDSSKFESSLKQVQVAAGATNSQIDQVRKASLKFGADIHLPGLAAADAADTFRLLAVSGISVQTSLGGAAKAALLLSRATNSSAQDSAKTIAASINAFKLNGNQAGQVADIVARSINKSGVSLTQFNEAFTQAGVILAGTFRTVQPATLTINQMSAALALFARNGLRGSQAGSNLKIMFQRLTNPTKPAAADIALITKAAGVQGTILFDAAGKTRTFAASLEILRKGLNKLPTEQAKAEALTEIFGQRSSIGARILTSASDADFQKVITGLQSSGFAAADAKAKFTGYNAAILNLKAIVKDAVVALFPKLQAAAGDVVIVIDKLIYHLTQGSGAWRIAREGLIGIGVALGGIIAAKGAVEVLGLLKDVSKALVFNPEGGLSGLKLLSLGLVGLAGVLAIVLSNSKSARDALKGLLSGAESFAKDLGKVGGQAFDGLIAGARSLYQTELPHLKAAYKSVSDDLSKGFHGTTTDAGLAGVLEHIGGEASSISVLFSQIGDNAKVAFAGSKSLAQRFSDLFAGLGPLVNRALGGLPDRISSVIAKIQAGFSGTSNAPGFLTGLGSALHAVATGAEDAYRWLKAAVEVVIDLTKQGYSGITGGGGLVGVLRGIGNAARDAVELVQRLGSNIGDAVSGGGSLGERLAKVFTGLAPIVNDLFGGLPEKLGAIVRAKLIDPVEAEFSRFFGSGSSIVSGILGLLRDVGLKLGRTVTAVITDPNLLKVVGATLLGAGAAVLVTVEGFLQGIIEKLIARLQGALTTSIGFVISHIPTALELVFLGIPLLLGKALVGGVVLFGKSLLGLFSPTGGVGSAWSKLVKSMSAVLATGLLVAFGLKTLAGPMKTVTSFFSDNFGSAARAGLKAALTGDQAGLSSIVAAAADKATVAAAANKSASSAFPGFTGDVISSVSKLRTGIDGITAAASPARQKIVGLITAAQSIGQAAVQSARIASPAFDTFATKVGSVYDKIKSVSSSAWSSVKAAGSSAFDAISSKVSGVYQSVGGLRGIAEGATAAISGFFSGQALASDGLTSKFLGVAGAVASIGGAFAVGGPILGGLAAASTLLGFITSQSSQAASALKAMRDTAADFTKELVTAQQTGDFGPVISDEEDKVTDLLKTYSDGFREIDNKVGGLRPALNTAFADIGSGKFTEGLDILDAKFAKFGTTVADDIVPSGIADDVNNRLKKFGQSVTFSSLLGTQTYSNLFADSKSKAEQIAQVLHDALIAGLQNNKVDGSDIFSTFDVKKVGDQWEIVRRSIDDASGAAIDFANQAGHDVISLYTGYQDVNGALGDQYRLKESIAAIDTQIGSLTLADSSVVDLINDKLSTQQSRLTDIQTQFDDLNGSKAAQDQKSSFAEVAKDAADATKALLANGSKIPDPFDISDTAQQVSTTLPALVTKYNSIVSGIVATKDDNGNDISPQAASALAAGVKAKIIGAAKQAGADRATITALDTALTVPAANAITTILSNTDEQQIRTAAQAQVQVILDQVQKNKGNIPVNLLAAIGTDTPAGLALQQLLDTGQITPPKGGFKPTPPGNAFQPTLNNNNHKFFARGDVVNKPTLGVFGEAGPEVIVPLSNKPRMIELLTQALGMTGGMPAFATGGIVAPRKSPLANIATVPRPPGWYAEGLPNGLGFAYYPFTQPHQNPGFLAAAPGPRNPGAYLESTSHPPYAEVRAFPVHAIDLQPALPISASEINKPALTIMRDIAKHPGLTGTGDSFPPPSGTFGPVNIGPPPPRFTGRQQLNAANSPQSLLRGLPIDGAWLDYDVKAFYSSPRPKGSEGLDAMVQRVQAADALTFSGYSWITKLAAQSHGLSTNAAGLAALGKSKPTGQRAVVANALQAALGPFGAKAAGARQLLIDNGYGPRFGIVNPDGSQPGLKRPVKNAQFFANGGFANKPSIFGEAGLELALPLTKPARAQQLLDKTGLQSKGDKDLTSAIAELVAVLADQGGGNAVPAQPIYITESQSPAMTAREVVKATKRKGRR